MAKEPRPGGVKTRLTPLLTPQEAAGLALAFLRDLVRRLLRLPDTQLVVALPAGDSSRSVARIVGKIPRFADQGTGDLGARLTAVTDREFTDGAQIVVVLGSDHPDLPFSFLRAAIDAAGDGDVGWVPTADGGYACLALPGPLPGLFRDVPWSTERVADVTRNNAQRLGVSLVECGRWYDVDNPADVDRLLADPEAERRCPETIGWLRALEPTWKERREVSDGKG